METHAEAAPSGTPKLVSLVATMHGIWAVLVLVLLPVYAWLWAGQGAGAFARAAPGGWGTLLFAFWIWYGLANFLAGRWMLAGLRRGFWAAAACSTLLLAEGFAGFARAETRPVLLLLPLGFAALSLFAIVRHYPSER